MHIGSMNINHVEIPPRHRPRNGFATQVLASLADGKASQFDLPIGKSASSVRSSLSIAAATQGFKVSVSIKDKVVTVWKKNASQAAASA